MDINSQRTISFVLFFAHVTEILDQKRLKKKRDRDQAAKYTFNRWFQYYITVSSNTVKYTENMRLCNDIYLNVSTISRFTEARLISPVLLISPVILISSVIRE